MKKQSGITLISLTIYIIVMTIVLIIMTAIVNRFYSNVDNIEANTEEILQISKLNTYFLKEIKAQGNAIDTLTDNYILFKTGNSFSFYNGNIYYNQIIICKNVKDFTMIENEKPNIIKTIVSFDNYTKAMSYKIEEIY